MNESPHPEDVILESLLMLPAGERGTQLRNACGTDAGLRQMVEAMLNAHEAVGALIASGHWSTAGLPPVFEKPGDRIGRYKLLERIGEGGCGVVYLAEQHEPVKRRVALKVIKLGMDTRHVIARFEAERQALALMDHPNIARIFDGGVTEAGRPYFVMELVRGVRLTDYCDHQGLALSERLELFVHVCQAVQHAHQKGVIHRDIKPSNILVTVNESGASVPKVIDFGIAKAVEGRLTEKTLLTGFHQFVGTPAYMSPEQAALSTIDIDTRSDIYSLGVLLYELLTGRTPFDTRDLLDAGLDALRHAICQQDPVRPSTRLETLGHQELADTARQRQCEAAKLIHLVRGDLDWIVLKSIDRDRSRRYATANDLAVDLQRHLNNEPVLARPPTTLYRFRRLVRRNRLAFASGSAVALALVLGLGLSAWLFFKERQAHGIAVAAQVALGKSLSKARAEAEKSGTITRFLQGVLKGVGPAKARGRDTTIVREIFDETARNLSRDLQGQPEAEAEIRATLGNVYLAIGDHDKAVKMFTNALATWKRSPEANPDSVQATMNNLAVTLQEADRLPEAEQASLEILALAQEIHAGDHPEIATALHNLAIVRFKQGKTDEAERIQRKALVMREELLPNDDPDLALSQNNLGVFLRAMGRPHDAEGLHKAAITTLRRKYADDHPNVARCLMCLAEALQDQEQYDKAEEALVEALEILQRLHPGKHQDVAAALANLAGVLDAKGKSDQALEMHRRALEMRQELLPPEHPDIANSLHNLAAALLRAREFNQAEITIRKAVAMRKKLLPEGHPEIGFSLEVLADALDWQGRFAEAEIERREAVRIYESKFGKSNPHLARVLPPLSLELFQQRKLPQAEAAMREALEVQLRLPGSPNERTAQILQNIGSLCIQQGKRAEAEEAHTKALEIREAIYAKDDPRLATSVITLAHTLCAAGKPAEAAPLAQRGLEIFQAKEPGEWATVHAQAVLGWSFVGQTNFVAAEPLLLAAGSGIDKVPANKQTYFREALRSLVILYEATDRPEAAREWREKLSGRSEKSTASPDAAQAKR